MNGFWCVEFSQRLQEFHLNTLDGVMAKNQRLALEGETDGFSLLKVTDDFDELCEFVKDFKKLKAI